METNYGMKTHWKTYHKFYKRSRIEDNKSFDSALLILD